jgi:hypothetical protein
MQFKEEGDELKDMIIKSLASSCLSGGKIKILTAKMLRLKGSGTNFASSRLCGKKKY